MAVPNTVTSEPVAASDSVYRCLSRPRGLVLVVNNIFRDTKVAKHRLGAEKDTENLNSTFSKMGYEVIRYEDLTKPKTLDVLTSFRDDPRLSEVDCAVVCVLSHGDEGDIVTADGDKMNYLQIRNQFLDSKCPNLKGKPKIFLFNFCRGKNLQEGCILDKPPAYDSLNLGTLCCDQPTADKASGPVEAPRDMFMINAAVDGVQAMRDRNTGTFLVQSWCSLLAESAHNTRLDDLTGQLSQNMTNIGGTVPEITKTHFTKAFYFNPVHPEE